MIKSKFSGNTIFFGSFVFFPMIGFTFMILNGIKEYSGKLSETLILLFISFLYLLGLNFLKYIRIINIDKSLLTYYSLLCPLGKTISLKDYIGKITVTETGSAGSYEVIYLVNKKNKTTFKIMGLHYKNFDEIKKAINLPEIKKNLSIKEYFILLFTGVLDLSKVQNKKNTEFKINKFLGMFIAIALAVFLIGMLLKFLIK